MLIKSNHGHDCIIEPCFEGNFTVSGGKSKKIGEGVFSIKIEKGAEAILFIENADDLLVQPVETGDTEHNCYGLRKSG